MHGYFNIWLDQQRREGKLKLVKDKKIHIYVSRELTNYECLYTGEVDLSGKECGFGTAINIKCPHLRYKGTFF